MLQRFDEQNRNLIVNINGQLVHRDDAGISPFDSAVQGGDAVWEGLRLYNGRIFKLYEHLDRLHRSATALSFPEIPSREKIVDEIKRTLAANKMRDGVHIRLTLTRGVKITSGMDPRLNQSGPTLIVLAEHKAPVYAKTGLSLITSKIRRPPPEILDPKIHHANLNSWIENLRRRAPDLARNQSQSSLRINGGFVFGEDDQRRPTLIKARVHPGSNFHSARERKAN